MPTNTNFLQSFSDTGGKLPYVPSSVIFVDKYKLKTWSEATNLGNYIIGPPIEDVIFASPDNWLSSLMWYPFDVNISAPITEGFLKIGPTKVGENDEDKRIRVEEINQYTSTFFSLGEYYYAPHFNNFADFNGYTKIQMYLPFYGFIEVLPNDVLNKYIQIRLGVDYNTGTGTYYIGVSDMSIPPSSVSPISIDSKTVEGIRVICTVPFQLGLQIPLGSTNSADVYRNIIMGAVKAAASATVSFAVSSITTDMVKSSSRTVTQTSGTYSKTSSKTNRPITPGTWSRNDVQTRDVTYDNSAYHKANAVSEIFSYGADALSSMHLTASSGVSNNSLANCRGATSVFLIVYRPKIKETDENYNHLYGKPLGEAINISLLEGYSEISRVHFEGQLFDGITLREISMIEELFNDGVIL